MNLDLDIECVGNMPLNWQEDYLREKKVAGPLRDQLAQLLPEESSAIYRLISTLNPSANTLSVLLNLMDEIIQGCENSRAVAIAAAEDIAKDRSLTLISLLSAPEVLSIFDEKISRKEKQKKFRQLLEEKRYPTITKLKAELESCRKELVKVFGLRLELPNELEGDKIQVIISIDSAEELSKKAHCLEKMCQHPALAKIFSLLQGDF